MTHDELLAEVDTALGLYITKENKLRQEVIDSLNALRAVVELHKPINYTKEAYPNRTDLRDVLFCPACSLGGVSYYPCPTIQAIEKELA